MSNQRGAVQIAVVVLIAIIGIVGTGAGVWYVKDQQQKDQKEDYQNQLAKLQKKLQSIESSASPSPLTQDQLSGGGIAAAESTVKQFVLAVANPSQPPTVEQRKAAVKYLTPKLQAEVNQKNNGDPFALLSIQNAVPFEVSAPQISGDQNATTAVTFRVGQSPVVVNFTLVNQNGTWLIDTVTAAKPAGQGT